MYEIWISLDVKVHNWMIQKQDSWLNIQYDTADLRSTCMYGNRYNFITTPKLVARGSPSMANDPLNQINDVYACIIVCDTEKVNFCVFCFKGFLRVMKRSWCMGLMTFYRCFDLLFHRYLIPHWYHCVIAISIIICDVLYVFLSLRPARYFFFIFMSCFSFFKSHANYVVILLLSLRDWCVGWIQSWVSINDYR